MTIKEKIIDCILKLEPFKNSKYLNAAGRCYSVYSVGKSKSVLRTSFFSRKGAERSIKDYYPIPNMKFKIKFQGKWDINKLKEASMIDLTNLLFKLKKHAQKKT